MIAALFVQTGGVYFGLPGVDPWDEARDARQYKGPFPVVAHPPCSRWCKPLAMVNETRYGHKVGDDGDCFAAALAAVLNYGGVLEHPANSAAWETFSIAKPHHGQWVRVAGGWTTQVSQAAYGHRAEKLTWLFYSGHQPPPPVDWSRPAPIATVSWLPNTKQVRPRLSKAEAKRTPLPFRDLLLSLAAAATPADQVKGGSDDGR